MKYFPFHSLVPPTSMYATLLAYFTYICNAVAHMYPFIRCVLRIMENCTNCSGQSVSNLSGTAFGVFLILLLTALTVVAVLIIITMILLCVTHSVAKLVRLFLSNLLLTGLLMALLQLCLGLNGVILNFTSLQPPHMGFCRFLSWGFVFLVVLRVYSLAGFSIVVLLIIRYPKPLKYPLFIVFVLVFMWCVPMILSVYALAPPVFPVTYYDRVACVALLSTDEEVVVEARYTFTAIWTIFGGLIPLIVSIVVPIVVLCYVKRNTMTEGTSYNKGIARFALFLVAGNLINIVGQGITVIVFFTRPSANASIYVNYSVAVLSLIPSPILTMLYLKAVRKQFKLMLCCHWLQKIPKCNTKD